MRKDVKRSELIKHRTYTTSKSDKLLLELVYRVWYTDGSIERIHIPKIELPFSIDHQPNIRCDRAARSQDSDRSPRQKRNLRAPWSYPRPKTQ